MDAEQDRMVGAWTASLELLLVVVDQLPNKAAIIEAFQREAGTAVNRMLFSEWTDERREAYSKAVGGIVRRLQRTA